MFSKVILVSLQSHLIIPNFLFRQPLVRPLAGQRLEENLVRCERVAGQAELADVRLKWKRSEVHGAHELHVRLH